MGRIAAADPEPESQAFGIKPDRPLARSNRVEPRLESVNLEAEGMEVIEAEDGRTGVQLAKREQPDLILLGVMMPVLDGWQARRSCATIGRPARSRSSS